MFCPSCLMPNAPNATSCASCKADLSGAQQRMSLGAQFLFVDASARRPIALAVDGDKARRYTAPLILSRHRHDVGLGKAYDTPGKRQPQGPAPQIELPRLPAPAGPELGAVVTDRKIYRPREEAHVFVVAPDLPGGEVEIEMQLAGQQMSKDRVRLDETGTALHPLAGLEEGEYTVLMRRPGKENAKPARCTFSVAEFTLSPLVARLGEHRYEPATGRLSFRLSLLALSVPYDGPVELGLQCAESGDRVVARIKARARDGQVGGAFDVRAYGGPFRIQATTPSGETASVYIPGTEKTERERITLCPLGRVAEAGLLPGEGTQEVRGLHVGYDGEENTPLRLESAVAGTGRLVADVGAARVKIVTFQPITGEQAEHDFEDVEPGQVLEFPVAAPYTLFTAGLMAPRLSYEAWGVVVRPPDMAARLAAPAKAQPGEEIAVRVECDRPAACLLLVYDARLEHESPVPKLGKQMMDALRAATSDLKEQAAPSLPTWGWYGPYPPFSGTVYRGGPVPPPGPVLFATAAPANVARPRVMGRVVAEGGPGGPQAALSAATEVETLTWVAAPSREDFPEVAYLELLPVRGVAERPVRLGDQIGAWRCRAYVVGGLDVHELTADMEVSKPAYAELDVPAIVGRGDDILAGVRYHTAGPATLSITLPDGKTIAGAVMGHGLETFHLVEPGEVTVRLSGADGEDWTSRTVSPPGVQSVTTSRLEILKRGETMSGERVLVFPGPSDVLKDTIEALGRYPFG